MGGDLLKKCIVQSICFALYLALSYVACAFVAIGEDYIEEEEAKHGNE